MARRDKDLPVKTAIQVFEITEGIRELEGAGLTELANHLDRPKSSVHEYVTTLTELGYLTKQDGTYDLGLMFLDYGVYARRQVMLSDLVQPSLDAIAHETNEMIWYMVEEHGEAVYVSKAKGDDALQPYGEIGMRTDLYDIAGGKAILAHLSDDRIDEIIGDHGFERRTEHTITSRDELDSELEFVRDRGYALNRGENIEGWRAIASPIIVHNSVYGAVVVAGPENRLQGDRFESDIPEITKGAANELQLQLRNSSRLE